MVTKLKALVDSYQKVTGIRSKVTKHIYKLGHDHILGLVINMKLDGEWERISSQFTLFEDEQYLDPASYDKVADELYFKFRSLLVKENLFKKVERDYLRIINKPINRKP